MGKIIKIDNAAIRKSLETVTRQYLAGNLSRPQEVEFIREERLEIGISRYPEYAHEPPHIHDIATEYQYMISGWTEYMDVDTGEIYEFSKGDFYAIFPGTAYAQRIKAGTDILFIKTPSINDKRLVKVNERQGKWLSEKMKTVRTDYYHCEDAPAANSVKPAAAVAILNDKKELLMLHRKDNQKWTMPGGTLEYGESMTECALREVKEESGLDVEITDIIGTYTDPNIRVAYSDGEVRQEFTIVYFGKVKREALPDGEIQRESACDDGEIQREGSCNGGEAKGGEDHSCEVKEKGSCDGKCEGFDVRLDEESSGFQWVSLQKVLELPMAESQRRRIKDVIRYVQTGKKIF